MSPRRDWFLVGERAHPLRGDAIAIYSLVYGSIHAHVVARTCSRRCASGVHEETAQNVYGFPVAAAASFFRG